MSRYAVVGASSGTGLELVRYLSQRRDSVRAISRHPPALNEYVEPVAADILDASAISRALQGQFSAVFFTVDIHGLFNSRKKVRDVMYHGFLNVMSAMEKTSPTTKLVLLSVIGSEKPSWVWTMLDTAKRGMRQNVLDRENALKQSKLPFVICRAPKLNDNAGGQARITATPPQHKLDMKMGISRADLARSMVLAAERAPDCSAWDIFADAQASAPEWMQSTPARAS